MERRNDLFRDEVHENMLMSHLTLPLLLTGCVVPVDVKMYSFLALPDVLMRPWIGGKK